ncbi:hypothetical protein GCM10027030_26460 [Luteococcus sediminum]
MEKTNGLDQFYSQMNKGGKIEYFADRSGRPTMYRPHAHVTHRGGGFVDIVATDKDGRHVWQTTLRNPNGNDVNRAISDAWRHL